MKTRKLFFVLLFGTLLWVFNTRPAKAIETIYIGGDGSISPPEAPVSSLDGVTYSITGNITDSIVVERSNIVIDGAGYTVEGDGTGNGFSLLDVANVTIKNTRIDGCFDGIWLFNSSDITITDNVIVGNSYEGIGLYYSSGNIITASTISHNQIGIALYDSSNNLIVHCDIVNNSYQAHTESSVNIWDDGSKGNYWGDYDGTDSNQDGVGDTPYVIDLTNQDRYPLMNTSTKPQPTSDINEDGMVNILDIFIVAQAFGSSRGDPKWNAAADLSKDDTVNILDIFAVARDFGRTT